MRWVMWAPCAHPPSPMHHPDPKCRGSSLASSIPTARSVTHRADSPWEGPKDTGLVTLPSPFLPSLPNVAPLFANCQKPKKHHWVFLVLPLPCLCHLQIHPESTSVCLSMSLSKPPHPAWMRRPSSAPAAPSISAPRGGPKHPHCLPAHSLGLQAPLQAWLLPSTPVRPDEAAPEAAHGSITTVSVTALLGVRLPPRTWLHTLPRRAHITPKSDNTDRITVSLKFTEPHGTQARSTSTHAGFPSRHYSLHVAPRTACQHSCRLFLGQQAANLKQTRSIIKCVTL